MISVVVPAYNAGRFLAAALDSALAQTRPPEQLIVVDDGSTDDTAAVAARYRPRVELIRQNNRGAGAARNAGIAAARGDWIAVLDADDLWMPQRLELQLAAAAADPGIDLLLTMVEEFSDDGSPPRFDGAVPGYCTSAVLVRRGAFDRVGPFAETLVMDASDWFIRAHDAGLCTHVVPATLVRRRLHADNLTRREQQRQHELLRLLKASLDRRRGAP